MEETPPAPEEPDEKLTPEELSALSGAHLLKRFWISARGFWGRKGDRFAWPCCVGLLVLIGLNVVSVRDQCLEPRTVRRH